MGGAKVDGDGLAGLHLQGAFQPVILNVSKADGTYWN
jgi:hypothetical protein